MSEEVTLKNGSKVVKSAADIVWGAIDNLRRTNPGAFAALIEACQTPGYTQLSPRTVKVLDEAGITDRGVISGFVRNILNSSLTGEGLTLKFGSPYRA